MTDPDEFFYDIPINAQVLIDAPGDQPYLGTFLGCIVDRTTDKDMAIIRPKGWERKLIVVHPSCVTAHAW